MEDGISGISLSSSLFSPLTFKLFKRCCTRNLLTCWKLKNELIISNKQYNYHPTDQMHQQRRNGQWLLKCVDCKLNLFHEKKDFVAPTPDIVLDFLRLHLNKILNSLWSFYNAKVAAKEIKCKQYDVTHFINQIKAIILRNSNKQLP